MKKRPEFSTQNILLVFAEMAPRFIQSLLLLLFYVSNSADSEISLHKAKRVPTRAVTFYSKLEYSFESGGKSPYSNVMTCSKSKCTVYKRNRPLEVIRLVIQQRAPLI